MKYFKRIMKCILFLVISVLIAFNFLSANAENIVTSSAEEQGSIFKFTAINETECDVRLADKTATLAVIPEKAEIDGKEYIVTIIAVNGFTSATKLEKVRIPKTVKTIGQAAFMNCKALTSITLPAVESIGTNAFAMTNMEYIILPKTLTSVASTILRNSTTKVYARSSLPEGMTAPEGWASNWNGYNKNQEVEFSSDYVPDIKYKHITEQVEPAGISLFSSTLNGYIVDNYQEFCTIETSEYTEVYIPATYNGEPVIGIANSAFAGNSIQKLTIGYSEKPINIESFAFLGLDGISLTINRDVTFLDNTFDETSLASTSVFTTAFLTTIILPNTITELGDYMFQDCFNLTDIHFITPQALTQTAEETIVENITSTSEVILPETVTSLGTEVFTNCHQLKKVQITNHVETVGERAFNGWHLDNNQHIEIDFTEADLPAGWNALWNKDCDVRIIEFISSESFSIVYHLDGGTSNNPTTYTRKDHIILEDAVKEGYIFDGWYSTPNFEQRVDEISLNTSGDLELYAKYTPITYSIVYLSNTPNGEAAEGAMEPTICTYDTEITLSENNFSFTGWHFVGWNTKVDASGTSFENCQQIKNLTSKNEEIIKLFAQWERNEYRIEYKPNKPALASHEVRGNMEKSMHTCYLDQKLNKNQYTLQGWIFTGWSTMPNGSGTNFIDENSTSNILVEHQSEIQLYAQWTPIIYNITFNKNQPESALNTITGSMATMQVTYEQEKALSKNQFELKNWYFDSWNTKADGSGIRIADEEIISNMADVNGSTIELYAQWNRQSYIVEYNPNKPSDATGEMTGSMSSSTFSCDLNYCLSTNIYQLTGWRFVDWNTKADGSGISFSDQEQVINLVEEEYDKPLVLYAQWIQFEYYVKYESNQPSEASNSVVGSMERSAHKYDIESNLKINEYSLKGWNFIGWNKNSDGTGEQYTDEQSIKNLATGGQIILYAQWEPQAYHILYKLNYPLTGSNTSYEKEVDLDYLYDQDYRCSEPLFELVSWRFVTWNTQADCEGISFAANESFKNMIDIVGTNSDTVNLYAQWSEKSLIDCKNANGDYEIATYHQFISLRNYATNGYTFILYDDFNLGIWDSIPTFSGILNLNRHSISYMNNSYSSVSNYGFILENNGTIKNGTFFPRFTLPNDSNSSESTNSIGGVVAINRGSIANVMVDSKIGRTNSYMNQSGTYADINWVDSKYTIGGVAGQNYNSITNCINYASIASSGFMGGIVGINMEGAGIRKCKNYGDLWLNMTAASTSSGGIVAIVRDQGIVETCDNYGAITFALLNSGYRDPQSIANIAGSVCVSATITNCHGYGTVSIDPEVRGYFQESQLSNIKTNSSDLVGYYFEVPGSGGDGSGDDGCIATGTLITLADGRQVPVETLTGNELLLTWNMLTGKFEATPILFIDKEEIGWNKVVNLTFSDGTTIKVITEHGFWDISLNQYVYLDDGASDYIGHWFNKQDVNASGNIIWTQVQLLDVSISLEYTTAYSPVTAGALCYYVNGMLSMPGGIKGLFNIFDVNPETMTYDVEAMNCDIETYGLFTYEEFSKFVEVPQKMFDAVNGAYLKVAIGKGLITTERLQELVNRYIQYFQ